MIASSRRPEPNWVRYLTKMLRAYRSEVGEVESPQYRQQLFLIGNALYRDLLSGIGWYRASFRRSEIEAVIEGMRRAQPSVDPATDRFIEIVEEVMVLFQEEPFGSELISRSHADECSHEQV
jgi:hypothetical protein